MGFLDRILAAEQADIHNDWKVLQEVHQLDSLISDSFNKPVVIFKHSIRCGTSAMAKFQLEQSWDFSAEDLDFYYLDLINHRKISNQIAEVLNVVHQSPQMCKINF